MESFGTAATNGPVVPMWSTYRMIILIGNAKSLEENLAQ
jgi:hypothetical protein